MATYVLRGLDPAMIGAAKARAREAGTTLDAVLRAVLAQYASGESQQRQAGRARWEGRSAAERRAHALRMVAARKAKQTR